MKKINLKKYFSYKNAIFLSLLFVAIFLFGGCVFASDWVNNVVGGIIGVFISGVTKILILLVNVLIVVASYSDFIHADAVTKGWVVVRDVCNMFFVVILLVIAFATILGQEEYSAKKNLPKLIIAAVLINFSKLFCGLMIDVASVVMLTFVNAFKEIGSGNIIDMLGISDVLKYGQGATPPSLSSTVAAYIFGLIYVLIATVVVASMLAMLVMRIVMIWIYVVLSPAAFFLQAVPGKGQQYASQWWSKWSSNLIVGPVLAFFLWLSFAALQSGNPLPSVSDAQNQSETAVYVATEATSSKESIDSKAGSVDGFAKFVIAIGMLLGGMKIAQEVGGETGSVLGKGMSAINKGKAMAISGATSVAKGTGRLAGRGALGAVSVGDRLQSGLRGKGYENKTWAGKMAKGWGDDLQAGAKKRKKEAISGYLKKMGMGEKTAIAGQEVVGSQSFQKTANVVKGAGVGFAAAALTGVGLPVGIGMIAASGAAGYFGSRARGKSAENVKNYDSAQGEYSRAEASLNEHNGHQTFVDEFDKNKARFDELDARPKVGFNRLQGAELDEYNEKSKIVNDKNNIAKYGKSSEYLENSDLTAKQKTFQDKKTTFDAIGISKDQYDKDKKIAAGTGVMGTILKGFDRFSNTKAAWNDMTKDQTDAKTWVKNAAANTDTLTTSGKPGNIYSSSGLSKTWKNRLDVLNKGGGDADSALANLIAEIKSPNTESVKLVEMAKAISAYEGGGVSLDSATLGKLKGELAAAGEDPAKFTTTRQYKNYNENLMDHKPGTGQLAYETFAKNGVNHEAGKDIMDVSFAKLNAKLPANFKLKDGASVNEASGEQLKAVSGAMANLIDDEIKALQSVPDATINTDKISQLNTAKARLLNGDVNNLSLNNSDMIPKGANDSERRRNLYNNKQHEIMHSAGATNEAAVYEGSDALQSAKLAGRIPGAGGERYDVSMGKMIAEMEKAEASQEAISQAITSQVEKWKVPNAQRVMETEKGLRDSSPTPAAEIKMEGLEKAINKLGSSLDGPTSASGKFIKLTPTDKDFFRKLSAKEIKVSSAVVEKLKPLGVMAAAEEKRRNP